MKTTIGFIVMALAVPIGAADHPETVFADFEGEGYDPWITTGQAFGSGPAQGTLPGQMAVTGYQGKGLVNSFVGGDKSTGTLTSPEFTVSRKYIRFLIGGGGYEGKTCINLLIDGKIVRSATGPNTNAGGSEALEESGWEVSEHEGKPAQLQIVDSATGGWGHINVDHIVFTDRKPRLAPMPASRELTAHAKYMLLPVKTGGSMRKLTVTVGGQRVRWFDIELADNKPDWWALLDVSAWQGQTLTVSVDRLPTDSQGLAAIEISDKLRGAENLYREPLRPQFHFSARRGWLNDPNGLVFYKGEYHFFFQHNPYGWAWGNMHWGHAVSKDLVHWEEQGEALYPDEQGAMFSGSAVVDWKNTSGLGKDGQPPLILAYTAFQQPAVQGIAFSNDAGRTFTKYEGNPILKEITPGNRDPKIIWHEPTKKWVMVLYVERGKTQSIDFFTSSDLKSWTATSRIDGFFECPDFFELPVEGDPKNTKWILTAANSEYRVGTFDGKTFTPETAKLPGHRGKGFYAAQTFSDIPIEDGRRIQTGWLQAPSPGMPFNQAMSVPIVLTLHATPDGPRMHMNPVKELETLRGTPVKLAATAIRNNTPNPLEAFDGDMLDLETILEPGQSEIIFHLRGIPVSYNGAKQELRVGDHRLHVPLDDGRLQLRVLLDRTVVEVFASRGRYYVPIPVIAKAENRKITVTVRGEAVLVHDLAVYPLKSAWKTPGNESR